MVLSTVEMSLSSLTRPLAFMGAAACSLLGRTSLDICSRRLNCADVELVGHHHPECMSAVKAQAERTQCWLKGKLNQDVEDVTLGIRSAARSIR